MIEDQEIYRTVLAELPVGVYFVDREQHIAFWNHGAEEITGYLSQQVLGHHMGENFLEHVDGDNHRLAGQELHLMSALREGKAEAQGQPQSEGRAGASAPRRPQLTISI